MSQQENLAQHVESVFARSQNTTSLEVRTFPLQGITFYDRKLREELEADPEKSSVVLSEIESYTHSVVGEFSIFRWGGLYVGMLNVEEVTFTPRYSFENRSTADQIPQIGLAPNLHLIRACNPHEGSRNDYASFYTVDSAKDYYWSIHVGTPSS